MDTVAEEWKLIPGFIGYEISNRGKIRSLSRDVPHWRGGVRKHRGRVLQLISHRGYLVTKLGGQSRVLGVHQLVALTWIGPAPDGKVVNHIDGVKTNNSVENLEYITNAENVNHAYRTGLLSNVGANNGNARLTDAQVNEIRVRSREGWKNSELARRFKVSRTHIGRIVRGDMRATPDDCVSPRLVTAG